MRGIIRGAHAGLAFASTLLYASLASAQVAIVSSGPSDQRSARYARFADEVKELMRDDAGKVMIPAAPTHVGDNTLEGTRKALQAALDDKSVKVVVGFGYFAGVAAAELKPYPKKPILLALGSVVFQGLPKKGSRSGRKNLTYLSGLLDIEKDITRFREVIKDRRVAFMVDADVLTAARKVAPPAAFELPDEKVMLVPIPPTAEGALAALPSNAEAVYIEPAFRMSFDEMQKLIDGLNARKLPTYAAAGPDWVRKGAFVTLVPHDIETERYRRLALHLRDALIGDPVSEMNTAFPRRTELLINMGTAREIGVYPSFELMTEAQIVRPTSKKKVLELDLRETVRAALKDNPAYRATADQLAAAEAELRESRGNLLPQIDLSADYTWIDPDVTSEFFNAERTLQWGASASQILYSPLAFQAYFAQQSLLTGVEAERKAAELDLVLEVVQSFLRVLQARAVEVLQRDNLSRVRTNRGLAELRVEIGSSGRQDVARWNIELADGRVSTINASAQRNQAEIDLNRILAVELERSFVPKLPDEGPESIVIDARIQPFVQNLYTFRIFRAFMADEALRNSPELKQLDAQIAAQDKLLDGYVQQLFIPNLGIGAGFTNVLDRAGAGSGTAMVMDGSAIPQRDDFTWQAAATLTFTLFDDTRYGTISRIRRVRSQLANTRQNVSNQIEQRVRSALHQAGASGAAVSLRQDAVAAARVNLSAVTSAYREGTTNIITLVDAQTQSLQAELNAASALYTFLSDFAAAERASGRFLILATPEERDEFVQRLEAFAVEAGDQ